ncbi:MAG: major capsid family protein [Lactobacillus panisapium]|uniref:major capsid family protein n=1 Tax=Lactobacillus sp. B4026 TaxID=2818035 RepID=UPI00226B5AA5|nr:major capsid family protein [Lactobacillus sp. B4026]MCT6807150.1 DUF2184 domain-containing protein [Bombilactobacillus sp.]MCT6854517.1 DUF2184 domain-containing protein [Lactobacillus panisapium]MCT6866085.1 DUF2184 domain-containing protein [Lactobacillus panisapium]MCX8737286.1 DUF2184 domain-containing protein [Lactobacillus sp. B4026]
MPNLGIATKEQLTFIDKVVYDPKTAPLIARSLFSSISIGRDAVVYRYRVRDGKALAKAYTNRSTDIPVVDEGFKEYETPITQSALAASYSWLELERARSVGVDLLVDQAQLVARGMAEREDQIIFNGLETGSSSTRIVGLTNTKTDVTGFQQINAEQSFAELIADPENGALKLRNFFQEAVGKITHLIGYAAAKPTLLLPQAELDLLNRPFNKYNPQVTVRSMIEPWFASIQVVPELEGQYWHAKNASKADKSKDMGIICLTDPEICAIPDAMPLTQLQPEYSNGVTKIPYVERHGGLAVRYPSAFVQLLNIN